MGYPFVAKATNLYRCSSRHNDERIATMAKEIIRNAKEQNGNKINMITEFYNGNRYVGMATNANPFDDVNHLSHCLIPSTSGDNSGLQGSGMKIAMFLGAKSSDAELIVHSHRGEKDGFSVRLTSDGNDAIIEEYPAFSDHIRNSYGHQYKHWNNYFYYRSSAIGMEFSVKTMAFLIDLVNSEDFELWYLAKTIGNGPGCKFLTYAEAIKGKGRHRKYPKQNDIYDFLCVDSHIINVENIPHPTEIGKRFKAQVRFDIYPNIRDKESNLIILSDCSADPRSPNDMDLSSNAIIVKFDKDTIISKNKHSKNISRLYEDAVYTSMQSNNFLSYIGLRCPRNENFISEIQKYSFVNQKVKDKATKWSPKTKITVTISDHKDLSGVNSLEFLSFFGDIDEFAYCSDTQTMRDVLERIFYKINDDNSDDLKKLKKAMEEHFPYSTDNKMPMPSINNKMQTITAYILGKKEEDTCLMKDIDPGHLEKRVDLYFPNKDKVQGSFSKTSEGVTISPKNDGSYMIYVEELFNKDENGTIKKVSAKDYQHSKCFFPKSICTGIINGKEYRFNFAIKVPPSKKLSGSHAKKSSKNNKDEGYSWNYYPGLPGEFVMLDNGILKVNEKHPISILINTIPYKAYDNIFSKWCDFYLRFRDMAMECEDTFKRKLLIKFTDEGEKLNRDYDGEFNFALNKQILSFIYNSKEFQNFLSAIRNINDGVSKEQAAYKESLVNNAAF